MVEQEQPLVRSIDIADTLDIARRNDADRSRGLEERVDERPIRRRLLEVLGGGERVWTRIGSARCVVALWRTGRFVPGRALVRSVGQTAD